MLILSITYSIGCSNEETNKDLENDFVEKEESESSTSQNIKVEKAAKYVTFSLNAQEFLFVEEGIETANRVIDIHEEYNVPVDIFVTNTIIEIWEEQAPDLIERLKNSDVIAVSYHIRPPTPYASNYDFIGLEEMDDEERYETIVSYEEHTFDPNNGLVTEKSGGYEHVKQLIGYAPKSVGILSESEVNGETAAQVFKDKGAVFYIVHGSSITPYESEDCLYIRGLESMALGNMKYDFYVRPESAEIKLYECLDLEAADIIENAFKNIPDQENIFLNIKMHDNNFFSTKSAWSQTYSGEAKRGFGKEGFNYLDLKDESLLISEEDKESMWELYEATVSYASNKYDIVNAAIVEKMV